MFQILDNKVHDRLATVEEETAKLRTEFIDFKKTIGDKLADLEKIVQDLQEKFNSISSVNSYSSNSTSGNNTSGTSGSTVDTDTNSGRSDNVDSSNAAGRNRDSTDYISVHHASTAPVTPFGVEHIYEDPRDFYPDSLPRYRAPPPPGPPGSSIRLYHAATSAPPSQQQQQQQVEQRSREQMTALSLATTTSTSLSLMVPPSEPLAQPPSSPRPPPRTAASSTPKDTPFPPTSSPPRRPNGNTSPENLPRSASTVSQLRDNFQNRAASEPARHPAILRSVSNPHPSIPPAVKPRTKPRVASVGAPGFQTGMNLEPVDDTVQDDTEQHESGTVAIRGIRTRPGLDIHTGESDTLVIGPISPFLDPHSQVPGAESGGPQPVPASSSVSVSPTPNTVHSIMFTIENMGRFKAATKKLAIQPFGLQIECSLKLQSKDQLLIRLDGTALPGNAGIPGPSPGRQQRQQHQARSAAPTAASRAHICIIHLGRDVSDDKILDQGWMLNIYQPCSMFINPKELFKVKGYIKLLVEVKIEALHQSHC